MKLLRRRIGIALVASGLLLLPGCFSMQHTVGRGPQAAPPVAVDHERWFALFGLVAMDDFDSKALAGGSHDYRVTTEFTFTDACVSALTSLATFYRQTVVVER
jgi:hypothetical protein